MPNMNTRNRSALLESHRYPCLAAFAITAAVFAPLKSHATSITDWTSVDTTTNVAQGTLIGIGVTFSGTDLPPGSITNLGSTRFNHPFFDPSLPMSDEVRFQIEPNVTSNYSIVFSSPITDPLMHVSSLASTITFGVPITQVSGQPSFNTAGNTISGAVLGGFPNDANGTIQFLGTFSSIPFSGTFATPTSDADDVVMQLLVPEPTTLGLWMLPLLGLLRRRDR